MSKQCVDRSPSHRRAWGTLYTSVEVAEHCTGNQSCTHFISVMPLTSPAPDRTWPPHVLSQTSPAEDMTCPRPLLSLARPISRAAHGGCLECHATYYGHQSPAYALTSLPRPSDISAEDRTCLPTPNPCSQAHACSRIWEEHATSLSTLSLLSLLRVCRDRTLPLTLGIHGPRSPPSSVCRSFHAANIQLGSLFPFHKTTCLYRHTSCMSITVCRYRMPVLSVLLCQPILALVMPVKICRSNMTRSTPGRHFMPCHDPIPGSPPDTHHPVIILTLSSFSPDPIVCLGKSTFPGNVKATRSHS